MYESVTVSVLCCKSYGSDDDVLDLSIWSGSGSVVTKEECPLDSADTSDDFLIRVTDGFRFSSLVTEPDLSWPGASFAMEPSELPLLELCLYLSDNFRRESSPGSTYTSSKLLHMSDSVENDSDVNFLTPPE